MYFAPVPVGSCLGVGIESWEEGGCSVSSTKCLREDVHYIELSSKLPLPGGRAVQQAWTALHHDGPNHLGLRLSALLHQKWPYSPRSAAASSRTRSGLHTPTTGWRHSRVWGALSSGPGGVTICNGIALGHPALSCTVFGPGGVTICDSIVLSHPARIAQGHAPEQPRQHPAHQGDALPGRGRAELRGLQRHVL